MCDEIFHCMIKSEECYIMDLCTFEIILNLCNHKYIHIKDQLLKHITLNSSYNEVTFNEKLAITKENICTKYTPFTYNNIALNEKPPIMKQNLHIFLL